MKIAIMQPYLFPYLGYFQLVSAVDEFVFFDDVNFINRGWINRNQILQQNAPFRFTVPLNKASQNRMINEIEIADYDKWRKEFVKQLESSYKKAPNFSVVFKNIQDFLFSKEYNLIRDLAVDSVKMVSGLLRIDTKFNCSSNLNYLVENTYSGQDKIIRICGLMGADHYINPKNGTELYDADIFERERIKLNFINMEDIVYSQFVAGNFAPHLSIIDVMMFNGIDRTIELLNKYMLN